MGALVVYKVNIDNDEWKFERMWTKTFPSQVSQNTLNINVYLNVRLMHFIGVLIWKRSLSALTAEEYIHFLFPKNFIT